jgi:hypothetical protein
MFIPTPGQDELLPDIPILTFDVFDKTFTFGTIKITYEAQSLLLNLFAYLSRTFEPKACGFIEGMTCGHCNDELGLAIVFQIIRGQWVFPYT